MSGKKKLCIVATVPVAIKVFMREHIYKLSQMFAVTIVSSGDQAELKEIFNGFDVQCVSLNVERKISLFEDLKSLFVLRRFFANERFDAVHSLMPKSGLLAMLAAKMAGVPVRVHIFTGQVWSTSSGALRLFLKALDQLLAGCATHLMADSPSQKDFLVTERVVGAEKITVLGKGSISGVDENRFKSDSQARAEIRTLLGVAQDAVIFLFMARVTKAKGAIDMARAFRLVADKNHSAHLLMVGPDEEGLEPELASILSDVKTRFHRVGFTDAPERYMAASDVFCLPSYREGFSLATIQAAGAGLPAVASRIYGLTDAVDEPATGLMHPPGDIAAIAQCMVRLHDDEGYRHRLAHAAQERAHSCFSQQYIVGEMVRFYSELLV